VLASALSACGEGGGALLKCPSRWPATGNALVAMLVSNADLIFKGGLAPGAGLAASRVEFSGPILI